jgi:transcriptional regulator with XRE-family HTH domain
MRQLRERAGISLMAAAEELEFSRARMYRIENGEVSLRKHDVLAMCSVYGADAQITEVLVGLARGPANPSPRAGGTRTATSSRAGSSCTSAWNPRPSACATTHPA